jgi:lipopolysaccharide export system protein LptA
MKYLSLCVFAASTAVSMLAMGAASQPDPGATQDTIIRSKGPLTMKNNGIEAHFVWIDEVVLTGTNLEVTCDKLEVFAERAPEQAGRKGALGSFQGIRRILASGHVVIRQEGRKATAELVEVLPADERIVLTGDPVVTDPAGTVKGTRITFFRGKQEFEIENPEVIMRALPNLGFPQQAPAATDASAPTTPATPAPTPSPAP